jgi:hypothetical protein
LEILILYDEEEEEEHHGCTFHNMNLDSPELLAHPAIATTIIGTIITLIHFSTYTFVCEE